MLKLKGLHANIIFLLMLSGCAVENLDEQQVLLNQNILKNYHFKQIPETLSAPAHYVICDKHQADDCDKATPIYVQHPKEIKDRLDTTHILSPKKYAFIKTPKINQKLLTKSHTKSKRNCRCIP